MALTKISTRYKCRLQFVFRFPQVFCYQMHHAIFRLDCAANTEKAHRLCQYGITLKDTFPNDNVDETRLILRHRVPGRCRQITKITRAMMAKAEAERCAVVMVRGVKASAVRAVRARAVISCTPVKDTIAHKASKADWRRKARWRKMSATKRL